MKITVDRYVSDEETTLSKVFIDGVFQCYGLEDEYREVKVKGETRIPAGDYSITLRTTGGFHARYTRKYPGIHKGMLWVRDVPGFEYILIHTGNHDGHTAGCLLLGASVQETPGDMAVWSSRKAYRLFYQKVVGAAEAGDLTIEYVDLDRENGP